MSETDPRRSERGQMLVLFTLALVAIMTLAGLVIDGGSLFVQRRAMQNVVDQAALAAGYAYTMFGGNQTLATLAAQGVGIKNGYDPAGTGVTMSVGFNAASAGAESISVTLSKPHPNTFSGVVGQSSWMVTTTASAMTGPPNGAMNAMPLIFNQKIKANGLGPDNIVSFDEPGTGPQDVPQTNKTFNWTVFCLANGNPCNGNTNLVDDLIKGTAPETDKTITLNKLIGPLNAGAHTALFSDLAAHIGDSFPVAIVDDSGALKGVAIFHLLDSLGGSTKQIRGYFEGPINPDDMFISGSSSAGSSDYGSYIVKLSN